LAVDGAIPSDRLIPHSRLMMMLSVVAPSIPKNCLKKSLYENFKEYAQIYMVGLLMRCQEPT
jgi:hypothetical protein